MNTRQPSFKERHTLAMLEPQGEHETTLATLFIQLTVLSDRYHHDTVMLPKVQALASCITGLAGDGETGRIDGPMLQKQVRDTIRRAGGDPNEL